MTTDSVIGRQCSTWDLSYRSSQAPRLAPTGRRVEPGERGIHAPLTVMERLVLHELPREQGKGERGSIPIDRRPDIDGFQYGEQVSLLVVQRGEECLPSQRAEIVLVLSRPIHSFCRQRGIVDTAHTDDVAQLLAKRREAVANPMWCPYAAGSSRRVGREVPLVVRDRTDKIGGQVIEHLAVPYKVIDRHWVILTSRFGVCSLKVT